MFLGSGEILSWRQSWGESSGEIPEGFMGGFLLTILGDSWGIAESHTKFLNKHPHPGRDSPGMA
jgi:hypothetical protein